MKDTIIRGLYFWLLLIALLQPMLSHNDYLLDLVVKGTNAYITEKAAPEGRVTNGLYQEAIDNLTAVGFSPSQISIEYDVGFKERMQRIDVITRVERTNLFVYDFSTVPGNRYYFAHNYVMSEYLD